MKNLGRTITIILGISILSFQSKAADVKENVVNLERTECCINNNHSAWVIFKEVVNTFDTASGKFQNLDSEKQAEFITAASVLKTRISAHSNEHATAKLKRVDFAANLFRFLWENKATPLEVDFDMEVPLAPVLG